MRMYKYVPMYAYVYFMEDRRKFLTFKSVTSQRGGGPGFMTVCDRGEGVKNGQKA